MSKSVDTTGQSEVPSTLSISDEHPPGTYPPGSVAEIMASPPGPTIGAFFDLDGTIVAGFTGIFLTREQFRHGDIGVSELMAIIAAGLTHQLGWLDFEQLLTKACSMLRGRSMSDICDSGQQLFTQQIRNRIYPEMRALVNAHLDRGHTVVLSSSALTLQGEPVARYLGIDNILTNRCVVDDNDVLTGDVVRPILWGAGKADAVRAFADNHGIDLQRSYFYADGDEDVALMYVVGNPRPTNPKGKMAVVARRRGWPILTFTSRGHYGPMAQIRTLLGISSLAPSAAGALGWGLLTGSRRRGVNFFTTVFPQLLLAANNVTINVIGQKNLTIRRPAVFIFNHRNNIDPVIVAAMIKDNWTGIGKKELENDPLIGTLGKLVDMVFIDRNNHDAAVESLHQVEKRVAQGLSIMIAPEGTRYDTRTVGPFKKGPFRLAMAAGVPIIPVVIRNADSIAPKNTTIMNPGTVDVVVHQPISLHDWTHENLADHIEGVRRLYIDTLMHWPDSPQDAEQLYQAQSYSNTNSNVNEYRSGSDHSESQQ